MKKLLGVALGILTAIGGFLDIGDLVTNAVVGSRFGLSLAWVVVVGVVGICLFAQMSGTRRRGQRARDVRDHPRAARAAGGRREPAASFLINLLTLTAEVGGIALALQLASSIEPRAVDPGRGVRGLAGGLAGRSSRSWRTSPGCSASTLIVFAVAVFLLGTRTGATLGRPGCSTRAVTPTSRPATYWYYAIALFGAAMTPYEVFFFSSGAVEEKWKVKDLVAVPDQRAGRLPARRHAVRRDRRVRRRSCFLPQGIEVDVAARRSSLPVAQAGGKLALAVVIVGIVAATFGAALETSLSSGYTLAQFFGWSWGKFRRPAQAARFHLTMIICLARRASAS